MTATPRIVRGGVEGMDILSMDDFEAFGPVAFAYSFAQALADGVICDIDALIPVIEGADTLSARVDALCRVIDEHGLRKVMSFHATVAEAQAFSDRLKHIGRHALHANGRSTREDVQAAREALAGTKPVVVTNARLFSEGIDIPSLDGVFFASIKRSVVDITQQIGRAVRKAPGKERGYLILPPVAKVVAEDLGRGQMAPLWRIVSSVLEIQQPMDERWDYGQPHIKLKVVGGSEADAVAAETGLSRLVEIRRIGLADYGFVKTADRVAQFIERGGRAFSASSPYRTWLSEAARSAKEGRLNEVRLSAYGRVRAAIIKVHGEKRQRMEAYVEAVENGDPPDETLSASLKRLGRNPAFSDLAERLALAQKERRVAGRGRMVKFLEAYEAGEPTTIDPSAYATLFKGNAYHDLLPRFRVEFERRQAAKEALKARAVELKRKGMGTMAIAQELDVTPATVRRWTA